MKMYWLLPVILAVTAIGLMTVMDAEDSDATVDPSDATLVDGLYYTRSWSEATIVGYSSSMDWSSFNEIPTGVNIGGSYCSVTSIGDYAFQNSGIGQVEWESYGGDLHSIGAYAFSGCSNLEISLIPQYVTEIGEYAFQNCSSMGAVEFNAYEIYNISEGAFKGCTNLEFYSGLPYEVTEIGDYAFQNCTKFSFSSFNDNVASIGNYAFDGCTGLELNWFAEECSSLSIGNYAFRNCSSMDISTIPSYVTSIGNNAFDGCSALTNVVIMGSPTIGSNAFANCPNLVLSVLIGDLKYSFSDSDATCSVTGFSPDVELYSGVEIQIPNTVTFSGTTYTVTSIGDGAFSEGYGLVIVSLPNNLVSVGDSAFWDVSVSVNSLPDTLTTVGPYAFAECPRLTADTLPSSLTSVGMYGFWICGLTIDTIPEGLTSVGSLAFASCTGIKSLNIEGSPTIGNEAFSSCTNLKYLIVEGSPTFGTNVFRNCANLKQVLNLGDTEITTTSYGLNADEVRTGEEGFDAVTMLQEVGTPGQHETIMVEDDSITSTILRVIPIFLILAVIIILAGTFYYRTDRDDRDY